MRLYTPGAWGPGPHGVPFYCGTTVRDASPSRYCFDVVDDPRLVQMNRSEFEELFRPDSGVRLEIPAEPTPDTAAVRLACLALRQAGLWGPPAYDVDVAHPRFAEAVEAAAAADDEQQALDAATAILEGPESL